ncbi:LAMI_0A03730g1_1 [Lachancea mirantina]|uniref:LAMI_0A03730g1_1 n=1 Tax=Lachancea mirantina TaxID=1230905 RepID=A0A1G4INC0_9SACH|nr:LAMI_0A03730g1_1 [Lachancea mirantina]
MSINGLITRESPTAPFVPLEGEKSKGYCPTSILQLFPLGPNGKAVRNYEHAMTLKGRLFVTSLRVVFVSEKTSQDEKAPKGSPGSIDNVAILYRQMTFQGRDDVPPHLVMPWLGSNYVSFKFNILPEQIEGNRNWLNFMYTWEANAYVEGNRSGLRDIFVLHSTLKEAITDHLTSQNAGQPTEDVEPLPFYEP